MCDDMTGNANGSTKSKIAITKQPCDRGHGASTSTTYLARGKATETIHFHKRVSLVGDAFGIIR